MKDDAVLGSQGMDGASSIQQKLLDVLHSLMQEAMRARFECEEEGLLAYVKSIALVKESFSYFIEDDFVLKFDPERMLCPFKFKVDDCARILPGADHYCAGNIVTVRSGVDDSGEVVIDFAISARHGRFTESISANLLGPVNMPEFDSCAKVMGFIGRNMPHSDFMIGRGND